MTEVLNFIAEVLIAAFFIGVVGSIVTVVLFASELARVALSKGDEDNKPVQEMQS